MYIKERVIATEKLASINPLDISIYKTLENMNVGGRGESMSLKEPLQDEVKKRFLSDCRKFLVELCQQMLKRFTFEEDSAIAMLRVLDPKLAVSSAKCCYCQISISFPDACE